MTANTATMDSSGATFGAKSVPITSLAVVQPVTDTGRKLYEKTAHGAQWYVEQWEDLFAEARHMALGATAQIKTEEVLAHLATAKVASDIPGRLRLRLKDLRWQDHLVAEAIQAVGALPGVRQVQGSTVTGSILVFYDARHYESSAALLSALTAK